MGTKMTTGAEPAAAALLGGKTLAALAVVIWTLVSILAIMIGFRFIPLDPVDPLKDAATRLGCGLLLSFLFGPALASYALDRFPSLITPWIKLFPHDALFCYLMAATPFVAIVAVAGFWVWGLLYRTLRGTDGKDIQTVARETADLFREVKK